MVTTLGSQYQGQVSVIRTSGNPYAHAFVVMKPNDDAGSVAEAEAALAKRKSAPNHDLHESCNSNKDPFLQPLVLKNITEQIIDGNKSIIGIMVESHLKGGRQEIPETYAIYMQVSN